MKLLEKYINDRISEFDKISAERTSHLLNLRAYVQKCSASNSPILLNMICTHNSRRSHLAQVWAQVAAHHFGWDKVVCFSGGTEATAVYKSILKALENSGLELTRLSEMPNPVFAVNYSPESLPLVLFSKTYDHKINPSQNFGAVMTCTHADANCPVIPNAQRISLPYVDPKISDGTEDEAKTYAERCAEVAREMLFVFSGN